jgi:twinkle protein
MSFQTVSHSDIEAHLRKTWDFRPVVKNLGDLCEALEKHFHEQTEERAPTMTSTKLAHKLHFRPGEVTAWAGYNGHRKSMFLGQVVADVIRQGRPVLIMSMEMAPEITLSRIARQMSGVAKPSRQWLEEWAEKYKSKIWIFDYVGRLAPDIACGAASWFASVALQPHIVMDSMMMICGSEESMDEQKQFITDLVRTAQEGWSHVHLVAHCRKPARDGEKEPPTKYELRGSAAISDQCHNVVTVWANKSKAEKLSLNAGDPMALEEPDALVTVEKQRNGQFEGRIKLWFDEASFRFRDSRYDRTEPYA